MFFKEIYKEILPDKLFFRKFQCYATFAGQDELVILIKD